MLHVANRDVVIIWAASEVGYTSLLNVFKSSEHLASMLLIDEDDGHLIPHPHMVQCSGVHVLWLVSCPF